MPRSDRRGSSASRHHVDVADGIPRRGDGSGVHRCDPCLANLGGFVRPYLIGWIRDTYHRIPANLRGSVPLIVALLVSALRYRMH